MTRRTKTSTHKDEQKWHATGVVVQDLQGLLQKQQDPRLHPVKIWLNRINEDRGMVYLGISLGEALGCSPFCGCAAKQIGDQFEPFLLERLPWLSRVIVEPEAPAEAEADAGHLLFKLL